MRTLLAFVVLATMIGCGGRATDAADDDGRAGSSNAKLACSTLGPDQDICSFGFAPDEARVVADVTLFAKSARDMRADVELACKGALADLQREEPEDGRACETVNLAIGGAVARLDIQVDDPRCETVAPPACVSSPSALHTVCRDGSVTATAPSDATSFERLVASILTTRYGAIVRARRQLEPTVAMAGSFSGSISAMSTLPDECIPRVTAMVSAANDDLSKAASQIPAALAGIVTDRP